MSWKPPQEAASVSPVRLSTDSSSRLDSLALTQLTCTGPRSGGQDGAGGGQ